MSDIQDKALIHGAAVTHPADRHARKRQVLRDAYLALEAIRGEKNAAVTEAQSAARAAHTKANADGMRALALRAQESNYLDLAAAYQQLAEETANAATAQEEIAAAAIAEAARLDEMARELDKPFRRREVPLERTIERIEKRLSRSDRRGA